MPEPEYVESKEESAKLKKVLGKVKIEDESLRKWLRYAKIEGDEIVFYAQPMVRRKVTEEELAQRKAKKEAEKAERKAKREAESKAMYEARAKSNVEVSDKVKKLVDENKSLMKKMRSVKPGVTSPDDIIKWNTQYGENAKKIDELRKEKKPIPKKYKASA